MNQIIFSQEDFNTFKIDGLAPRMNAIRGRLQPKFKVIGEHLTDELSLLLGQEMHLHIAQHLRRSVNPPKDTWLAVCDNKRGYKQHPHFQLGLYEDHLFVWLAFIYEMPNKSVVASNLLRQYAELKKLPAKFVVSLDHTKKDAISIQDLSKTDLQRFRDVKKAEFLVGRHFLADDPLLSDGETFLQAVLDVYHAVAPIYRMALS